MTRFRLDSVVGDMLAQSAGCHGFVSQPGPSLTVSFDTGIHVNLGSTARIGLALLNTDRSN